MDFEKLLNTHQPLMVKRLKLLSLVPYLNRYHLLTEDESEQLQNNHLTENDRIMKLISLLKRKGLEGYQKFLQALEEEPEHLGHKEVLQALKTPGALGGKP